MKNIIFILVLTCSVNMFSQIHNLVKWTTSVNKISDSEAELIVIATIQGDWHLYSQTVPEGGLYQQVSHSLVMLII